MTKTNDLPDGTLRLRVGQRLAGAWRRGVLGGRGHALPHWDDSQTDDAALWAVFDDDVLVGVVAADTFERAYTCAVDEIVPDFHLYEVAPGDRAEALVAAEADGSAVPRGSGVPANGLRFATLRTALADIEGLRILPLVPAIIVEEQIEVELHDEGDDVALALAISIHGVST